MKKSILLIALVSLQQVSASSGGFEDSLADFMSWVVICVLPIAGIYIFWKGHIYPEIVAEKNNHPQKEAIKTLCLLSLFFGGLLWPFAMIWATYKYPEKENSNTLGSTKIDNASSDDLTTINDNESIENSSEIN